MPKYHIHREVKYMQHALIKAETVEEAKIAAEVLFNSDESVPVYNLEEHYHSGIAEEEKEFVYDAEEILSNQKNCCSSKDEQQIPLFEMDQPADIHSQDPIAATKQFIDETKQILKNAENNLAPEDCIEPRLS
jgi:hypothetical protein